MFRTRILMLAVAVAIGAPVRAQDPDDGPGRGVARVSLLNGDVSVRRGDSGDYIAAGINQPLVVQDRIVTGMSSRAELQFDYANFLRMAGNAEVRMAELEHRRYIVQIARGMVTWRVLRDQDAYIEISTPSVSVRPVRKGTYRISVHEDGNSEITVRSGEAEIFTPRGSERLKSGRTMMARGSSSDPEFRVGPEIPDDDWDRWNVSRDRDLERTRSYDYISRDIYGADDLDHHGRWVHVSSYGWVWTPRVVVGWAPYRYGRWSWIDWYGWSWVSYDPWGWAPYHYGRWFYHAPVGWCWWPGGIGRRHYWSPGLVAFVGFGRVSVGVGWGRVGWIPLAPYEPYHRWYGSRWYGGGRNRTYIDNSVTVVNNVNVTNIYRNSRVDRAVTIVDNDGFRRGRAGEGFRGHADEFRTASLARGPVPVAPDRDSLRVADRDASVRSIDGRGPERFYSNRRPAEVERVSFDDQRRGVEQMARRSFGEDARGGSVSEAGRRPAPSDASARGARGSDLARGFNDTGARTAERSEEQRGWRRVGESPRGVTAERTGDAPAVGSRSEAAPGGVRGAERGGDTDWRRFGSARVSEPSVGESNGRGARSFGEPAPRAETGARGGDDWRRFGSGSVRSESSDVNRGTRNDTGESRGWRREASPSPGARTSGDEGWTRSPRMDTPRTESPSRAERSSESPRVERRDWSGSRGGESIRISPPIVRERGGDSGGGGRGMSAPRSAPSGGDFGGRGARVEGPRSAPSGGDGGGRGSFSGSRGGDGGGAARSSGGSSGGGRSGGGRGR